MTHCELLQKGRESYIRTKKMAFVFLFIIEGDCNSLMFIAGGTAYCRSRMKWYKGSECTRPRQTAHWTINMPIKGKAMNRTTMTPRITESLIGGPCRPGFWRTRLDIITHYAHITTIIKYSSPLVRFPPVIRWILGIVPLLHTHANK